MTTAISARTEAAPAKTYTVRNLLTDKQAEIIAALPKHITPAYFMRVVLTAVQRNPKLAQCSSISFLGAVLQCAQLGLVPDGFLGQAYLIPFENRKKNLLECQFQIGYRGLVTLARRSGEVSTIGADAVYERDQFKQIRGLSPSVEHVPFDGDGDPGALVYAYSFYRLKDGGYDLNVMNRRQVHAIRDRSQAYQTGLKYGKRDSPWFTDEAWMWKKTSLKQLLKLAPLSVEIQRAAGLDDAAEAGVPQDLALLADPNAEATPMLDGDSVDEETGDIISMPQRASAQQPQPPDPSPTPGPPPPPPPPPSVSGPLTDRILEVIRVHGGWKATTDGGLRLWTRDTPLGLQLEAATGQLRRITADPADAQGRRRLTALEA
jgi:recombination protein RecT